MADAPASGRDRPKVYVLDQYDQAGLDHAAQHAELVLWDDPQVGEWREQADGVMVRLTPLSEEDFRRCRRLRVVCKQGVGVESIDLAAARRHGIVVCNTPGLNSEAVAEMALALGLVVRRRVAEVDRLIRSGHPVRREEVLGGESWGRPVGIIGMGNIGTRVARKWHGAFEAPLVAFDLYRPADHWSDILHRRAGSLEEVLRAVDLLSLHLPLTEESAGMLGARELALMRPGAILINTARGGIVDEAALFDALVSGHLGGAGLDAFRVEPPTAGHPLAALPNVILSPHAAGGTRETQARCALAVARQLIEVLSGGAPWSRVV